MIEFPTSPTVCCCTTFKNATAYTSSQKLLNKYAMHAVISFIVVTMQEIPVISLTDFFDAASRRHGDVILLPAICRVSGNDFMFKKDSAPAHCTAHVQQLNCCVKKRRTFLRPTCGLQTTQISMLWILRSGLYSVLSTRDKSIVWMN